MSYKFTEIPEQLNYPPRLKATLSTYHSDIITYAINHFDGTNSRKSEIVSLMNTISYHMIQGNTLPTNWTSTDPFKNIQMVDYYECEEVLKDLFLHPRKIQWDIDIQESEDVNIDTNSTRIISGSSTLRRQISTNIEESKKTNIPKIMEEPTPKEYLYIKPPTIPRFDVRRPWMRKIVNNTTYCIYPTLPDPPVTQSQISITTDVDKMGHTDLLKLYPNRTIHTRSANMYQPYEGIELDSLLGLILPIEGFTKEEVRDNIIKYPHIFRLTRLVDGKPTSFYSHIEIDGELRDTLEVWDSLPESKIIPKNSEFVKEYVVRRYLLERDINKVEHKYPLFGTLDPFLTLFTTPQIYESLGYSDSIELARDCVRSRVSYKYTRNPVVRMVKDG